MRLYVVAWSVLILALLIGLVCGSPATAQDPMPATVAALQMTVAGVSTTVARQAT